MDSRRITLAGLSVVVLGCAAQNEDDTSAGGAGRRSTSSGGQPTLSTSGAAGQSTTSAGASNGGAQSGGAPGGGSPAQNGGMPATGGASGTAAGGNPGGGSAAAGAPGAAGAPACAAAPVAAGTMPLIDDFNHLGRNIPALESRSGVWDVWTLSATADMSPKSANYQTTGADTGNGYTHWTGKDIGGANDWGPTLTVQLNAGCPYDASAYSGISFKLKGSATKTGAATVPLKVMLWQPPAVPAKDAKGGTCTAVACYNHYNTFVNVPSSWDPPVSVPFASLTQGSWTGTMPFAWSAKQLLAIQFQVEVDGSKNELANFDLSLDDLMFVK